MDASWLEGITRASTLERTHTTILLNHEGKPAEPGDLIVLGPNNEATKAALLLKLHRDDPHRIFVISGSHETSRTTLYIACKGNGFRMGGLGKRSENGNMLGKRSKNGNRLGMPSKNSAALTY